jgi:hypothetical protein
MSNELATAPTRPLGSAFSGIEAFEFAQRQANALASSDLVPTAFRGKTANCLIALEVANRVGTSPLMVMQHLNVIHGKPTWSAQFIIATVNSSGRFKDPLQFKMEGAGDTRTCVAYAQKPDGALVQGPEVSVAMAKAQGWWTREGSKWPTMTDLMLSYRAATFFGRLHTPDLLLGMKSEEEAREEIDVTGQSTVVVTSPVDAAAAANERIRAAGKKKEGAAHVPDPTAKAKPEPDPKAHPRDKNDYKPEPGPAPGAPDGDGEMRHF